MYFIWRVRYFDRREKEFKDRGLVLDTRLLDFATRAAVEMCHEEWASGNRRSMLKYRGLFKENPINSPWGEEMLNGNEQFAAISVPEYFEGECAKEITINEIAAIKSGNPNVVVIPPGAKKHDIDYMFANKPPVDLAAISLSAGDSSDLAIFVRDLNELVSSALYKDGPGTISYSANQPIRMETATTDAEIRSFVTIFRRLYMATERVNFLKAVEIYRRAIPNHPMAAWINGAADEYKSAMDSRPNSIPINGREKWSFTCKRLIDVFLYTRYAHQPSDERTRQYRECLASVGGGVDLLAWLFLTAIWECSLQIRNAGVVIADFYNRYCAAHQVVPDVLRSINEEHPGVGKLERPDARQARLLKEKIDELADSIWRDAGRPECGPSCFLQQAREQLERAAAQR